MTECKNETPRTPDFWVVMLMVILLTLYTVEHWHDAKTRSAPFGGTGKQVPAPCHHHHWAPWNGCP